MLPDVDLRFTHGEQRQGGVSPTECGKLFTRAIPRGHKDFVAVQANQSTFFAVLDIQDP